MPELFDEQMVSRRELMQLMLGLMGSQALPSLASAAEPAIPRLPRRSDVVVSIRKVSSSADQALAGYHPTRIEWHYVTDLDFIRREKSRFGIGYASGTINANDGPNNNPVFYARDFDGKELAAPWMEGWGALWISVAADASRARLFKNADTALAAGCDGLQVDDGWFQLVSEPWGGDFSDASRAGFGAWLEENSTVAERQSVGLPSDTDSFDYRDWLRTAGIRDSADYVAKRKMLPTTGLWRRYLAANVRDFWRALRKRLGAVPLSMNFGAALPNDNFMGLADIVDYTMCELPAEDEAYRYRLYGATAEAAGLPFVGTFVNCPPTGGFRQQIAACYASGIVPAAPWDLFVPNADGKIQPRIYADPGEYADLYKFVRERAALFDGFGDGARVGLAVPIESYAGGRHMQPLVKALFGRGVPYRLIPVGGSYREVRPTAATLAGIKVIVLSHPRDSFSAAELDMLRRTRLPLIDADATAGAFTEGESIGTLVDASGWALVHRRNELTKRSIFHVVSGRSGASPVTPIAHLRHGTMARVEQAARARIHRPGKPSVLLAPSARSTAATQFELPTVDDWAMIELLPA